MYRNSSINRISVLSSMLTASLSRANAGSAAKENAEKLPDIYHGIYKGTQQSYTLQNQHGRDLVINGIRIIMPALDFQLTLMESGKSKLVHTNKEDGSSVHYTGEISVIEENEYHLLIDCRMTDGGTSSPAYILMLEKKTGVLTCRSSNEPPVQLQRIDYSARG